MDDEDDYDCGQPNCCEICDECHCVPPMGRD